MRKRISVISVICLLVSLLGMPISAEETDKICTNIVDYSYTTDVSDIIDMAREQKQQSRSEDAFTFEVEQLMQEKSYSDGSSVKTYAKSAVQLYSYDPVTREMVVESQSSSWGKYDIACVVTAVYESHWGTGTQTGIKPLYTTFQHMDMGSSPVYVTRVDMYSHAIYDIASVPVERYATYNYPTSGVIYSLNFDDNRIYDGHGTQNLYSGAVVTLSDGTVSGNYDLMVILR